MPRPVMGEVDWDEGEEDWRSHPPVYSTVCELAGSSFSSTVVYFTDLLLLEKAAMERDSMQPEPRCSGRIDTCTRFQLCPSCTADRFNAFNAALAGAPASYPSIRSAGRTDGRTSRVLTSGGDATVLSSRSFHEVKPESCRGGLERGTFRCDFMGHAVTAW